MVFSLVNKEKPPLTAVYYWHFFPQGYLRGNSKEPKKKKNLQTKLSTTKQWRRVTLQVSKPQSQKIRTSGQTTWENGYQKNTKQLLSTELKQGRYPWGGQAKHLESTLKHSLKQCNKAADSWETTAWKHRLAATEAGGGWVNKQPHKHPGGGHSGGNSRHFLQAKHDCQDHWQGLQGPAHKALLLHENHCSPAGSGIKGFVGTKPVRITVA